MQKQSVERFLVDSRVEPDVIRGIQNRMRVTADEKGVFPAKKLRYIMGEKRLAHDYQQACIQNPSLQLVGKEVQTE